MEAQSLIDLLRGGVTIGTTIAVLIALSRYVLNVQGVIADRFDHIVDRLRADVARLEAELDAERTARTRDNASCDAKIAALREALRRITPPAGYPGLTTGNHPPAVDPLHEGP